MRGPDLKLSLDTDYARVTLDLTKYDPRECRNTTIRGNNVYESTHIYIWLNSFVRIKEHAKVNIRAKFGDPLPVGVLIVTKFQ